MGFVPFEIAGRRYVSLTAPEDVRDWESIQTPGAILALQRDQRRPPLVVPEAHEEEYVVTPEGVLG